MHYFYIQRVDCIPFVYGMLVPTGYIRTTHHNDRRKEHGEFEQSDADGQFDP